MHFKIFLLFGATLMTSHLNAQTQQPASQFTHPRETIEWTTTYCYNANDNKLPRILLVGDSICNGYQSFVRDELAGTAYVAFCATSKCVTDKSYLRQLAFILDEYNYSIVHFNNGLHSLTTDNRNWEISLRAAIKLIKEKAPNAKIIWASSTPLKDIELTAKARELNALASKVMEEEGIPTDDLFSLMDPLDRDTNWSDTFHFKEATKEMQAKAVAECVRQVLGKGKASEGEAAAMLKATESETGPDGKISPASVHNH
jgi:hypothetical protein